SVTDCAVTLKAIAGHDPKDRYSATRFVPDYLAGLNGDINGIRIGIVKEAIDADFIQPEVKRTIETAIKHLSEIGADVTNVSIPLLHYSAAVTRTIMEVEAASTHRSWLRTRPQDYEHNVLTDLLTGCIIPAELYYKAQKIRHLIRGQVISALDSVDVLALPASSEPAPKIKTKAGTESKQEALLGVTGRRSLCSPFNLSNVPALVVPCGFVNTTGKEMPIGLQLAGRPFSDGMLLNVGYAYEQSTPWHRKRPPI
ncbi:hypothetical protein FIM12_03575, partial [SAR202 cluster bacterium AD-804-J14_MRT_500m]|nr:hypothetical protein [SAR202 cluster bacterium AD-804-J14_MRT_500m]